MVNSTNKEYGKIFFDDTKLFHGIGFDLLRFISIMRYGILSEHAAKELNIDMPRNFPGYNLDDTVSVTIAPGIFGNFEVGAYNTFVKNGIQFVISNVEAIKAEPGSIRDSHFVDERFVNDRIPLENIEGIIFPMDALHKPISSLPIDLKNMELSLVDKRCTKIISGLREECSYLGDTKPLIDLIHKKDQFIKSQPYFSERTEEEEKRIVGYEKIIIGDMERFMQKYQGDAFSAKFGKKSATLLDVVKEYVPENMKLYNSNGKAANIERDNRDSR